MNRCILLCGVGIQLATAILQAAVYLVRLAALGTLEYCVLGKVCQAILVFMLVACTCIYHQRTMRHTAACAAVYALYAVG